MKRSVKADEAYPWGAWPLPTEGEPRIHRIGAARLYVTVDSAGESPVLAVRVDLPLTPNKKDSYEPIPPIEDPSWIRCYLGSETEYELLPAYDTRPICVRLLEPFTLPPEAFVQGWLFTQTNASIRLDGRIMAELALKRPAKTLYGQPDGGIVCAFATSRFFALGELDYGRVHNDPATIAHPVRVHNDNAEPVVVRELCVHGEQLSIVRRGESLVSEALAFHFNASGVRMGIERNGGREDGDQVLCAARDPSDESAFERSVELFRAITRM